jgi:alkanesulfonate monooxygenase SsuD/methylene tetrahydromethanopterin reductase-like flavin-dependent oxidoreductase (luciferase family)
MQYGFGLPVRGKLANYDGISAMARAGEALGFTSATIADHVVFPTSVESRYPYDSTAFTPARATRSRC